MAKALVVQPEQQIENLTSTVESAYQALLAEDKLPPPMDENGNIVPVVVEKAIDLYRLLDHSADRHFVYMGAIADTFTSGKIGRARITLKELAYRAGEGRVAVGQYRKVIRICGKPTFQRALFRAMGESDVESIEPVSGKDFCLMILDNFPTFRFTHLRAMSDLQKKNLEEMAQILVEWASTGISSTEAEFLTKAENGGPIRGRAYYNGLARVQGIQIINDGRNKIARVTVDLGVEEEEPNNIINALKEARQAGRPLIVDCMIRGTKEKD
jgi:hypothetical protein